MKANSAPLQGWSLDVITILLPAETIRVPVMSMSVTCTLVGLAATIAGLMASATPSNTACGRS